MWLLWNRREVFSSENLGDAFEMDEGLFAHWVNSLRLIQPQTVLAVPRGHVRQNYFVAYF